MNEAKQTASKLECLPLMLIWMRFYRHPIDLIVFHDPFRKGVIAEMPLLFDASIPENGRWS